MRRRLFWTLLLAGSVMLGCSQQDRGENRQATATPAGDVASAAPELSVEPPPAVPSLAPFPTPHEMPVVAPPATPGPAAVEPAPAVAAPDLPLLPSAAPLEAMVVPGEIPPAPAEGFPSNPLRTGRVIQARSFAAPAKAPSSARMALPSFSADPAPAGGSSPPEGFVPEPGSAAPEFEFTPKMATQSMSAAPSMAAPEMPAAEVPAFDSAAAASPPAAPAAAAPVAASALPTASPAPANQLSANDPFEVVQVFYGTDREAVEPLAGSWQTLAKRYGGVGGALLMTLIFSTAALSWPSRRMAFGLMALCGFAATAGFGYFAASDTIFIIRQSAKEGIRYTSDRNSNSKVELGICEVTIPKSHRVGELEGPSILKLEITENSRDHIVLRKTERLEDAAFYEQLRAQVAASPEKEVFVFVHGFNTTFEDATRRTAQLAHDLPFVGVPICYSWPANEQYLLTYAVDETNVAWSAPHLKRFLLDIVKNSEAQSINLIAHSMGNRALTTALRELELEFKADARLFNQVVLAAPDIDAADFRENIAPAIVRTAQRVTLYASSGDQALAASQLVHRYPRAGDTQPELVLVAGLDTIDVSLVGSSPWGHGYYGSSDPILRDISLLLRGSQPAAERRWLTSANLNGHPYWVFQPITATAGGQPAELR